MKTLKEINADMDDITINVDKLFSKFATFNSS